MPSPTYDDEPLTHLLLRYWWPFWLFKDASRGDRMTRAAAYRHNRTMRGYLPGYLCRWFISCALALMLTWMFESLSLRSANHVDIYTLIAAACAVFFTGAVCVLFVTAYVYLYLGRNEG